MAYVFYVQKEIIGRVPTKVSNLTCTITYHKHHVMRSKNEKDTLGTIWLVSSGGHLTTHFYNGFWLRHFRRILGTIIHVDGNIAS